MVQYCRSLVVFCFMYNMILQTSSVKLNQQLNMNIDYPEEEINKYLEANPHLLQFFSPPVPNIGNRVGEEEEEVEEENLCNVSHLPPFSQNLTNTRGKSKTIINHGYYIQYVGGERCMGGGHCEKAHVVIGSKTSCVQRYITRRLLVYDRTTTDSEKPPFDDFHIPSGCECVLSSKKLVL